MYTMLYIIYICCFFFLTAKNLPAKEGVWIQFLGWKDSLEKEMATHFGILAWEIPWTEKPEGLSPWGYKESYTT